MYTKEALILLLRGVRSQEIDKNTSKEDRSRIMNECYDCINKNKVPGNAHIACSDPDKEMTGNQHGIRNGWFMYPLLFDPTWKTKLCSNYSSKKVNHAVSDSVSGAVSGE